MDGSDFSRQSISAIKRFLPAQDVILVLFGAIEPPEMPDEALAIGRRLVSGLVTPREERLVNAQQRPDEEYYHRADNLRHQRIDTLNRLAKNLELAGYETTVEVEIGDPAQSIIDRVTRGNIDAWVISGRLIDSTTQSPIPNVCVSVFDTDWIQDDMLGTAVTDAEGKFRIDYATSDFEQTPLSPIINTEPGGPDLYFKVETADGVPLFTEPRSRGHTQDREDAGHCFFVELAVEQALEAV